MFNWKPGFLAHYHAYLANDVKKQGFRNKIHRFLHNKEYISDLSKTSSIPNQNFKYYSLLSYFVQFVSLEIIITLIPGNEYFRLHIMLFQLILFTILQKCTAFRFKTVQFNRYKKSTAS